MNIDPSVSNREVLIRYLETSGVANQKEAAKLLRGDDILIELLTKLNKENIFRIDELETICAQSYQVVGVLADHCGRFSDSDVEKALDNLSDMELTHDDVLPFKGKNPSIWKKIKRNF